jgi:hypothetical protein
MVRREEQPWQSRATLFLDNRVVAHRGQGVASSLEAAVSAAASIALHLSHRGYTVRLVTASGEEPGTAWHARDTEVNTAPLLEALAVVQLEHAPRLDASWLAESGHGGLVVAVLGSVSDADAPFLKRLQHHFGAALAVALEVDRWAPHLAPTGAGAAPALSASGWRATSLGPGDRLDLAWQELGRMAARRAVAT